MNKKILGIIAGSVAALGSAIVAAPAHAQSANLPVTITVRPYLFLRTYEDLNFVVNPADFLGGSVEQTGSYDEAAGTSSLPMTPPGENATTTVSRTVPELFQVWGGSATTAISVTASKPILTGVASGTRPGAAPTAEMSVTSQLSTGYVAPAGKDYVSVPVSLAFEFSNPTAPATRYEGGELTISVTAP